MSCEGSPRCSIWTMIRSAPGIGCIKKRYPRPDGLCHEGSACRLSDVQQDKLTAWITETLPRTNCSPPVNRILSGLKIGAPLASAIGVRKFLTRLRRS